jgi:hypothetical protein
MSPRHPSFTMSLRLLRPSSGLVKHHCRLLSTSQGLTESDDKNFYPVYVHHLSKVALEHLQNSCADWVEKHGLSSGLKLNPDGTFVLKFPTMNKLRKDNGRIW